VAAGEDSARRYRLLADAVCGAATTWTPIGPEKAKAMMDSVARGSQVTTYLSVVALPDSRKMVVARLPQAGVPATRGPWVEVEWKAVFAAR
jgi:hypothetical protein